MEGTDDEIDSGSDGSGAFLSASELDDSDSDAEQPLPHQKKRRFDGDDTLGLELVTATVLHGSGAAPAAISSAHIDASEEAEASLLQLEVGDLLREARPNLALETALLELVRTLAALLRALPAVEVAAEGSGAATAVRGFLSDLAFHPVRPFMFHAPTRVQVVGSLALCAAVRPAPCLDLAVLIPACCLDSKDQLNHRYLAKRALYLAHIASQLEAHPQLGTLTWACLADDPRRPALLLHPPPGTSPAGFCIRLLPAAPPELCPLPKLGPARNNLRSAVSVPAPPPPEVLAAAAAAAAAATQAAAVSAAAAKAARGGRRARPVRGPNPAKQLQERKAAAAAAAKAAEVAAAKAAAAAPPPPQEPKQLATPHYNTCVLQDLLMLPLADACRSAAATCPHFAEAAALLRVWARQQQLSLGADGLTGTFLTLLLVHLLESGKASAAMPAMHLLRTALLALSAPKTFTPGLIMQWRQPGGGGGPAVPPPDVKAWRKAFEVVFVDGSGWLNLAAGVSRSALAAARGAAARSLRLLSGGSPAAFDAVFLARQRQAALFDYWFQVKVPPTAAAPTAPAAAASGSGSQQLLADQPGWRSQEARVEALATKALGSRARLVRVFRRTLGPEAQAQVQQQQQQQQAGAGTRGAAFQRGAPSPLQQHVLLGVQVDASAAVRGLDLGPSADKAEAAAAFRSFWGAKAELRRFQDGSIAEAVVWEGEAAQRHLIVDRMVSYILQRHLPPGTSVVCHGGVLDAALHRKHSTPEGDVAAARLCEAAAERLGKRLRSLAADSLPLKIVAVQAAAPVLRHAAAFPPLPQLLAGAAADTLVGAHIARCLEPVELLCQLEGSGRWPDSPEAYEKTKAALGCQLAQQLHSTLGVDAAAAEGWVDVLSEGFAFRLLLVTERDAVVQGRAAQPGSGEVAGEDSPRMRTWLQGAVAGVAGHSPAFEGSVRLAKRWVGAHLLSPHLGQEAVELILAHCFTAGGTTDGTPTSSSPAAPGGGPPALAAAQPPASRLSGFLRFLHLLAGHPWRVQPLLVDPSGELSAAQRDAITRQHARARAQGTAPALCLATPKDPGGGAWTSSRPSALVLPRIAVLAQRSAAALEALLLGGGASGGGAQASSAAAVDCDAAAAAAAEAAAAEAAAAATAAAVFSSDLAEYDVVIRLRSDALPSAANRLRLGPGGSAAAAVRPPLGPALQAANQQLAALAAAAAAAPGSKHSRSILKGIPQSILAARGRQVVRRELLVGFDPLPLYTAQLQQRLADLAVVCADHVGGTLLALKWRAAALAPAPLRPHTAHLSCPAGSPEAAPAEELLAARGKAGAAAAGGAAVRQGALSAAAVVPDVVGVLADALQLGEGLVASIQLQ